MDYNINWGLCNLPTFNLPGRGVRRRGKNIDSSSKSNSLRRRGKITTRRREGVGVVVEKMKKVDELSAKIRVIHLQH